MNKIRTQFLALLAMMLTGIGTANAATSYGLLIGETWVTSDNANDVLGNGQFKYNNSTKTLTVTNANLNNQGSYGSGIRNDEIDGLTIKLVGTNNITSRLRAISSVKKLTITGTGTLNATSTTSDAFFMSCSTMTDYTISGPTINLTGQRHAVYDYYNYASLNIEGTTTVVTMQTQNGTKIVNNLYSLDLGSGIEITEPKSNDAWGAYFSDGTIIVDGEPCKKKVVICHVDHYGITLDGTEITSANASDVFGNGQFSYNASSKRLTLRNATLDARGVLGTAIQNKDVDGLEIYLSGTSKITSRNEVICSYKSFSITGSGTLNGNADGMLNNGVQAACYGMLLIGNITCTVNGPTVNITSANGTAMQLSSGSPTLSVLGNNTTFSLQSLSNSDVISGQLNGIALGTGVYITEPNNAFFSSSIGNITTDGVNPIRGKAVFKTALLYVGETKLTPDNASDILGNGQFRFDYSSKTLYVTNATLENQGTLGTGISNRDFNDLTICFTGKNTFVTRNYAIGSNKSFSITGRTGTLSATSTDSYGFSISGPVGEDVVCTVDGPQLFFTGKNNSLKSYNGNGKLVVNGNTTSVTLQPGNGYSAVSNLAGLTMGSGVKIFEPEGGYYSSSLKSVTTNGTSGYQGKVVISSDIDYGVSVGETIVKTSNAEDVLGNGQFSYDPVTKTLTVKDAYLDNTVIGPSEMPANQGAGIINWRVDGLTVKLEGNNTFKVRNSVIHSNYPMTITGNGKLNGKSTESAAITLQGDNTVLTIDGPAMNIEATTYAITDPQYHKSKVVVTGTSDIELWSGTGYATIKDIADLELGRRVYINQPAGGYFSKQLMTVTTNGSTAYQGKIDIGYYYISIGETLVTPDNAKDVLGDGTVSYSADSKILTLNNARISNLKSGGQGITTSGIDGLNIKVMGYNTVNSDSWALSATKNFSITGSGTLIINATDNGAVTLWSKDGDDVNCTIDGPSVTLFSAANGSSFSGSIGYKSTVTIKGSTTRVQMQPEQNESGNGVLYLIDDFQVGSGLYITEPYGAYYDANLKNFTLDGTKKYCGNVVVGPAEDYGFLVADEVVTTANAKDVLGNGQFSYDPNKKVLTVKNANLTKTDGTLGTGIDIRSTADLTINIEGTNYIKTRNSAIGSVRPFRIIGTGTLNAISASSDGMLLWSRDTMTCTIDGPKIIVQGLGGGLLDAYNTATLKVSGSTTSLTFQPITTNLSNWETQPIDEYTGEDVTISGLKSLYMDSGISIIEPQGGYFNSSLQSITTDGTTAYKGKVVIGSNVDYGIYVAEKRVKSSNADDILGDGCFSYDPDSKTLYVRNANLTNTGTLGTGISNREVEGLVIKFEGTNTFTTRMDIIESNKSVFITGDGTLKGNSTGEGISGGSCIRLVGRDILCNIMGPTLDLASNSYYGISDYYGEAAVNVLGDKTKVTLTPAQGNPVIDKLNYLSIDTCLAITEPEGAYFSTDLKSITVDGTNAYKGKMVISKKSASQGEYFSETTEDNVDVSYHITGDNTVEVGAQNGTAVSDDATEVIIPETVGDYTVTAIAPEAFEWNYNLNTVYLPATIETIGYGAFSGCGNLYNVYIRSRQAPTLLGIDGEPTEDNNAFAGLPTVMPGDPTAAARSLGNGTLDDSLDGATLHVPDGCLDEYNKSPWNYWFTNIIPDATKHGDVNGDFTVDVADIATVIDVMATDKVTEAADVNNDGVVDVADIATVIDIMAANARRLEMIFGE